MRTPKAWLAGLSILLAMATPSLVESDEVVRVEATGKELGVTPIVVEYKGLFTPGMQVVLSPSRSGSTIPVNLFKDQGKVYLAFVLETVPATGLLSYHLTPGDPGPGIEMIKHDARIDVQIGGQPFTTYIPDDGPKPYYFSLIGPTGKAMTRAFPMAKVEGEKLDHPHHRSLWFTHGSVNNIDFWSEFPGHGTIKETSRPTVIGGAAVGTIRTTDDWLGPNGVKVCEDERLVRFWNTKDVRIIDFDLTIKATAGPVTFGDTKEGSFGLRVPSTMDVTAKTGGKIVNAEGITDTKAWGKPSAWVDYSGPVGGKTVGVSILNHPESFRYPTTWHVRDYGLFAANPFGGKDFKTPGYGEYVLPAGESIRFRYRVILHDGNADSAHVPDAFDAYQAVPKVTFP